MTIVFLHALPLDERMWEPQRDTFGDHDVLAPNLYSLAGDSMDEWALDLLREVPDDAVLVGASMGGYAALAFVRLVPQRVRALVLVGSRADADTDERKADRLETIARVQAGGAEALWDKMAPLLTAGASEDVTRRMHALALEQRAEDLVRALRAIRERADSTDVLARLDAPVLVLVGDQDGLISPEEARALATTARNGRAVVLDGAGHLPSLQKPDEFNAEVRRFVESLG